MRILGQSPGVRRFFIQTALVLDFACGYQLAGHVIWHGHFFIFGSPSKVPLKSHEGQILVNHLACLNHSVCCNEFIDTNIFLNTPIWSESRHTKDREDRKMQKIMQ